MLKPKEPFVVESDSRMGMNGRPDAEVQFKAILPGHPHFTPGAIQVDWHDSLAYVSFGVLLKDGMTYREILSEAKRIYGNGDCRNRPFPKMLANDVKELLFEKRRLKFSKWGEEAAKIMARRWEERELVWRLRLAVVGTNVSLERAVSILQEIMAVEQTMAM